MIICSVLFQSICQPLLTPAETRNPALYQDAICIKRFTLSAPKRFRSSVNIRRATELDRSEGTLEHGRQLSLDIMLGKKLPLSGKNSPTTPEKISLLPGRAQICALAPTTRGKTPSPREKIPATREKNTVVFEI